MQASVVFTAAEIAAGSVKTIVPAQGIGKVIVPMSLSLKLSTDWVSITASTIRFFNIRLAALTSVPWITTLLQVPRSASTAVFSSAPLVLAMQSSPAGSVNADGSNVALELQAPTGCTGGAGSLTVYLLYEVV